MSQGSKKEQECWLIRTKPESSTMRPPVLMELWKRNKPLFVNSPHSEAQVILKGAFHIQINETDYLWYGTPRQKKLWSHHMKEHFMWIKKLERNEPKR